MDLIKFILFLALVPYPLGLILTRWFKISGLFSSLIIGLFVISLESYFLGLFSLYSWSTPLILFQSVVFWAILIFKRFYSCSSTLLLLHSISPSHLAISTIILVCVYINCLMLVPFGQVTPQGISLHGAHFIDSTWHMALVNSLDRSLPPENPFFAGTLLTNYHFLTDLQISLIHRITGINAPNLFYRLFGPFYLLAFSWLVFSLGKNITGKNQGGIVASSFLLLGSNFYYLAPWFSSTVIADPSVAWVDFFSSKTVNYPLLVSLTLVVVFLDILRRGLTRPQAVLLGLFSGCLFLVKSHTALVWFSALAFTAVFKLFKKPPDFSYLVLFLVSLIVNYSLYIVTVSTGNGALIFSPLWLIRVMYESPERLNLPDWELRRQTLLSLGAFFGLVRLYLQGLLAFFTINFGLWLVSLPGIFKNVLRLPLAGLLIAALSLPLLFIQQGTAWNSVQFVYPAFIVLSLGLAEVVCRLFAAHRIFGLLAYAILLVAFLPGNRVRVSGYLSVSGHDNVTAGEVRLIRTLAELPYGTVLADRRFCGKTYIPAYSGKPFFVGDLSILQNISVGHSSRSELDPDTLECKTVPQQVKYLLLAKEPDRLSSCTQELLRTGQGILYAVNP